MSTRDSELEAEALDMHALESAPTTATFAFDPRALDEDRILEADEIAAELVSDFDVRFLPPTPAQRRASSALKGVSATRPPAAPPPPLAATPLSRAHSEITLQPLAADTELSAAREEIARLQKQMRARDAYLKELERALDASTRQLEAAGLGSVMDAYRMLGRLRGQAFRIAELESELRQAQQANAQHKPARSKTRTPKPAKR